MLAAGFVPSRNSSWRPVVTSKCSVAHGRYHCEMSSLMILSAEDVLSIHEVLVSDFARDSDPISPSGVRSLDLLESAVSRQLTGYDGHLKYDNPIQNAASLAYGICLNHPFHNGNKRTALVALLCHLDKNDTTFAEDVSQDELYNMMIRIASHGFAPKRTKEDLSDIEVQEIARWMRRRTRRVDNKERVITYRELRGILKGHGFELEHPKGNHMDVVRYERRTFLGFPRKPIRIRVSHIPYPADGVVVGKGVLKKVRQDCELTEKNGIDSHIFYASQRPVDYFVTRYRKTLKRLART